MAEEDKRRDEDEFDFDEKFADWMHKHIGISRSVLAARDTTDDWAFVILMHSILESALNHLVTTCIGNPKVAPIVSLLDTGNERTGKIAFIRAYELLSDDACLFIRYLGELRNKLVHDIRKFDFDLKEHLRECAPQQRQNWVRGLLSWCRINTSPALAETALNNPRAAINNACISIIIECLHLQKLKERLEGDMTQLQARLDAIESTPKES